MNRLIITLTTFGLGQLPQVAQPASVADQLAEQGAHAPGKPAPDGGGLTPVPIACEWQTDEVGPPNDRSGEAPGARQSSAAFPRALTAQPKNQQRIGSLQAGGTARRTVTRCASVCCPFQKLEAHLTSEGLWLNTTGGPSNSPPFRLLAQSVGRDKGATTALAPTGEVQAQTKVARWVRSRLVEEYTASLEGVRQDFIVSDRPGGEGALRLELAVDGASAQKAPDGARLLLAASGRVLAYNHLRVEDARGRELNARMQVVSPCRLAVVVEDAAATYPVRIDPTFSDAQWVSMGGLPGSNGQINAIVVDTNGDFYVGGQFTIIGTALATNVAKWNGSTWSALGPGMNGAVNTLAFDSHGNLYAGGAFTTAGAVSANNIAKWNGASWSALGSGVGDTNAYVSAVALDANGNLYAGGFFTNAGAVSATYIAQWNGRAWSALGAGMDGNVHSLALDTNGNLYAGGSFDTAGGVSAASIAKWDGTNWLALGSGVANNVLALVFDRFGNLYAGWVGGDINSGVSEWDGSGWSVLGSGMEGQHHNMYLTIALAFDRLGNLYAGGTFYIAGGIVADNIAKWDGSTWSALGSGITGGVVGCMGQCFTGPWVSALAFDRNGNLYAGGFFFTAGELSAQNVAKWDGSDWSPVGSGISNTPENRTQVYALAFDAKGNLYAGGNFAIPIAGGRAATNIAKWNGITWSALGSGISSQYGLLSPTVYALTFDANGNLYAGGNFDTAGGVVAANIAKWDGTNWSALGSGVGPYVGPNGPTIFALACDTNGNLYAGGFFAKAGDLSAGNIAKWDGNTWSALGSGMGGSFPWVNTLVCDGPGNLYAGGAFTAAGAVNANNVARWDGRVWSALGSGVNAFFGSGVNSLACDGSGNLYAGGDFTNAGGVAANLIAKWDGSAWTTVGSGVDGSAIALSFNRSGNLYAGGQFGTAGGVSANNVAKWDGTTWSALGSGIDDIYATVSALAFDSSGNLYAGGGFFTAGTNVSVCVAKALLTGPTPNQVLLTNAGVGTNVITYLGAPGSNYALDLATSLTPPVNWMPQDTNTASTANATTAGYLSFTNSNHLPQAYYRTRYVP